MYAGSAVCERDSGGIWKCRFSGMKKLKGRHGQVQNVRSRIDIVQVDNLTTPRLRRWLERFEEVVRNETRAWMCLLRGARHQLQRDE